MPSRKKKATRGRTSSKCRRRTRVRRKKKANPEPRTFIPTGELGRVTVIRYIRPGKPGVEFEHKFEDMPRATYDAEAKCLLVEGVLAGPV